MSRLRYAILALTLLAGLAGAACSDDSDGEAAATTTTTTVAERTTTTTPEPSTTTTTVAPGTPPPELIQTGDDLVAIVQSLHAWSQWLSTAPDLALLPQIAEPGTQAYSALEQVLVRLEEAGYRWDREQEILTDILLDSQPLPAIAIISATAISNPDALLLDQNGQVIRALENPAPPTRLEYTMVLDQEDTWRLNSIRVIGTR